MIPPREDSRRRVPCKPPGRTTSRSCSQNGNVLLGGGYGVGETGQSAELFDPKTSSFKFTGGLNTVRGQSGATLHRITTALLRSRQPMENIRRYPSPSSLASLPRARPLHSEFRQRDRRTVRSTVFRWVEPWVRWIVSGQRSTATRNRARSASVRDGIRRREKQSRRDVRGSEVKGVSLGSRVVLGKA